jgi:Uma2 family endonuclease
MAIPASQPDYKYTYSDYCSWPDDERWEIIEGAPISMSPAPNRYHQEISGNFYFRLRSAVSEKLPENSDCKVYHAPFDVRLPAADEADEFVTTVVQPDISIICDKSKLDDKGCRGAPDLVMEILSPSTASRDLQIKKDIYEKHGVKEYWIVQPMERIVIVYKLTDEANEDNDINISAINKFDKGSVYTEKDEVKLSIMSGVIIKLSEVFEV